MIKVVKKLWGREEWLVNNELYCLKKLIINPGGCCSLHAHRIKDETFHGFLGQFMIQVDGEITKFTEGHCVRIYPGNIHRFWVPKDWREAMFWEISTHHDDTDVIRYDDSKLL